MLCWCFPVVFFYRLLYFADEIKCKLRRVYEILLLLCRAESAEEQDLQQTKASELAEMVACHRYCLSRFNSTLAC